MHRRLAAGLAAALVLAATAACGDDSSSDDASAGADIPGLTVSGELGEEPTVETTGDFEVGELTSERVIEGDGDEVTESSVVRARIAIYDNEGSLVQGNFKENEPTQIDFSQDAGVAVQELVGQVIGSRVVVAAPVTEVAGEQGAPDVGLEPDESMFFVFDLLEMAPPLPTGPEGEAVDPPADAPKVESDGDTVTGLDFSDAPSEQPTEFQAIPLVEGTGPAVKENAQITVNYFGTVWGKGDEPFDSSFERGEPATFPLAKGSLIDGWVKGLVGVKEGSRVMLVIPSDLGYGDAGQPPDIPGGATLVFVIDVLRAE